jgi:hypothetical protein
MNSLNVVYLTETLEHHPQVRFAGEAAQVTTCTLCYDVYGQDGEMVTLSMPIIYCGVMAKRAAVLCAEDVVGIAGTLTRRKYADQNGQ